MVVYNDVTGLVEAMAANEELVSNVSHEFRSPLNSILGNIDLVLEDSDGLSALTVQRLDVVQRNSERLLALVSDLTLEASAALNVHPKRTDISGLVETSIGSAQAHAERSAVALVADVPSPLWAYADPLRIGQALDNLVSNAIKYSPDGGTVTISAAGTEDWVKPVVRGHRDGHGAGGRGQGLQPVLPRRVGPGRGHSRSRAGPFHHQDHPGTPRRCHRLRQCPGRRQHVHHDPARRNPDTLIDCSVDALFKAQVKALFKAQGR